MSHQEWEQGMNFHCVKPSQYQDLSIFFPHRKALHSQVFFRSDKESGVGWDNLKPVPRQMGTLSDSCISLQMSVTQLLLLGA